MTVSSPLVNRRNMRAHKAVRAELLGPAATAVASSSAKSAVTTPGAVINPPTTTSATTPAATTPKPTASVAPSPSTTPPATTSSVSPSASPPTTNVPASSTAAPSQAAPNTPATPTDTTNVDDPLPTSEASQIQSIVSETVAPSAIGSGPTAKGSSSSGFTSNTLIGVVVGGAVFFVLLVGCCWFMGRQRRRRKHIRSALDDDVLGPGGMDWRRRTQRLSRSGWRRSLDPEPKDQRMMTPPPDVTPYPLPGQRGNHISHGEARDSVRMQYPMNTVGGIPPPGVATSRSDQRLFVPPSRSHPAYNYSNSERSSVWADTSEADMYANDGSTIARTISTDTRPNSEYNLENDPGATFHQARIVQPHGMMHPSSIYSEGTYVSTHSGNTFGGMVPAGGFAPMPYPPSQSGTYHSAQGFFPGSGSSTYMSSSTMSPVSPHTPSAAHGFYEVGAAGRLQQHQAPPAQHQQQRIPAPRILVDTKQPIAWPEDVTSPTGTPASSQWASQSSTSLVRNAASPATGTPIDPRARNVTSPTMDQPTGSFATQTRPLVVPRPAASADLPYSTTTPGPAPGDPAVLAAVAATAATSPAQTQGGDAGSGLTRETTIVRHADGGAFDDAVPDGDTQNGTLHLPPAYGDIYGPPEPAGRPA